MNFKQFYKVFDKLSLKRKFVCIFGTFVMGAMIGIAVGQFVFARVQIGGKYFKGIELKRDISEDIARIRMNVNLLWGTAYSQAHRYDDEISKSIDNIISGTDKLFTAIKTSVDAHSADGISCTTCHAKDSVEPFFSYIDKGLESWSAYKNTLKEKIMSLAKSGNAGAAVNLIEDSLAESYAGIMEDTKISVDMIRGVIPKQIEKLKKESDVIRIGYMGAGAAITIFLLIIATFISSYIVKPVAAVAALSASMAEGAFPEINISTSGRDEIGQMVANFKKMSGNIKDSAVSFKNSTGEMSHAAERLSVTADEISTATKKQLNQIEQATSSATHASETIVVVAQNTSKAAEAVKQSSSIATEGKNIADNAMSEIQRIAEIIRDAAETIGELGKSSEEIGEIVSVITDIANQTNLLALNAAIEAARAGEQGRGFAVVADEVRKLAEKTTGATNEIAERIKVIQSEAQKSVDKMKKSTEEVDKGVGLMEKVSNSLESIVSASTSASDMVQHIAAATEEQSTASEEITHNVNSFSEGIRHTAEIAMRLKDVSAELAHAAELLKTRADWFKI